MAGNNTYDAGSISVLEGLEADENARECISEVYRQKV